MENESLNQQFPLAQKLLYFGNPAAFYECIIFLFRVIRYRRNSMRNRTLIKLTREPPSHGPLSNNRRRSCRRLAAVARRDVRQSTQRQTDRQTLCGVCVCVCVIGSDEIAVINLKSLLFILHEPVVQDRPALRMRLAMPILYDKMADVGLGMSCSDPTRDDDDDDDNDNT
ncbi:hypothetical protein ACI65C_008663 [Semiaphis heraclei]